MNIVIFRCFGCCCHIGVYVWSCLVLTELARVNTINEEKGLNFIGATGSRLLAGNSWYHTSVENWMANFFQRCVAVELYSLRMTWIERKGLSACLLCFPEAGIVLSSSTLVMT